MLMLEPVDRHEGIASAAVIDVPHVKMGEQVRFRDIGFRVEGLLMK
jgi:hypothetical protein